MGAWAMIRRFVCVVGAGLALALLGGSAAGAAQPHIIGVPAPAGTSPFVAFILYTDSAGNPQFACSGTVVSTNLVLTAGHCAQDETTGLPDNPSQYEVVTGSLDWTNTSVRQVSGVSRVIVNPGYDPTTKFDDAALLELSTPTTAPAIPLAMDPGDYYLTGPGTLAVAAGFGATYTQPLSAQLLEAQEVVQSAADCAQQASALGANFDTRYELCAIDAPSDSEGTCPGDSGGPLVAQRADGNWVEIGLTSQGPTDASGNCSTVYPDIFTRVDAIYSWVHSWIVALAPPPPPSPPQLPTMGVADARSYVRQTLGGVFGRQFTQGYQYTRHCTRRSNTRFGCNVTWSYGPNDYAGQVTVYYVFGSGNTVEWTDRYKLYWVNDYCYFHSGHPSSCKQHTKSGSY
jgi:secreted trypsin-like serine protease